MMTSSNGNIFRVTGHLCGELTGPGEFPTQRPVTRSLMFTLICARINGWVNNREAGDLRRYRAHYDVIVICYCVIHSHDYVHTMRHKTKQIPHSHDASKRWRIVYYTPYPYPHPINNYQGTVTIAQIMCVFKTMVISYKMKGPRGGR